MKRTPDVIFVVDGIYEAQALKEANSLNIKSFAILNTNGDDTVVDNCIPANTNSVKSTEFIANSIKTELSGVKAKSPVSKVRKTAPKKVSGERKTVVKKTTVKKEEK